MHFLLNTKNQDATNLLKHLVPATPLLFSAKYTGISLIRQIQAVKPYLKLFQLRDGRIPTPLG